MKKAVIDNVLIAIKVLFSKTYLGSVWTWSFRGQIKLESCPDWTHDNSNFLLDITAPFTTESPPPNKTLTIGLILKIKLN